MPTNGKDMEFDALTIINVVIASIVLLALVIITDCKIEKCP